VRVDSSDLSGFDVEMRLRNVADTFRLAMVKHPEYDDRYWRYIDGPRVEGRTGAGTVTRLDSALWRVVAPGGEAVVRYRLALPAPEGPPRAAWRPFLSPNGGFLGGPHAFLYVVGATLAPAHVSIARPAGWASATGLEPTADPRTFFAPTVDLLVDSPIMVGRIRSWRFAVDGVPHRIAYLPSAAPTAFDTVAFARSIEQLTRQAIALFGRAPYREFTFLFQDDAYGGLEHLNSVSLGAPSAMLADDQRSTLEETAHEYFHTWNLVRIRPAEYGGVDYRPARQSRGLWWSEGLTMYYADLLLRRAGQRLDDSTRVVHLVRLIERYLGNPGNTHLSPEQVSLAEYGSQPGANGDYDSSPHLQGELIGAMLDLAVRDATNGRRSMDDVMRAMLDGFSGTRGFTGLDVQRTVARVCGCEMQRFFDAHVRGNTPLDFDRWLRLAGLRTVVSREPALGDDGQPMTDIRVHAWLPDGEPNVRLYSNHPEGAWGRAGLHMRDRIASVNGVPLRSWTQFRGILRGAKLGDTLRVEVVRPSGNVVKNVVLTGFDHPVVKIEEIPGATARQRALRERWLGALP
jgi:predicted metalloprotease with PDZ domain